ncbi:hypothetical protein PROFUN_12195 [Planoprotostelium fungivorum]|uniref:Uncharacterized protein n=1 Tax=Planoprotostelium fungivorum TaxID=1890364 RepID=A0A2P6N8G4_9EUKA|nr:hypothetical protein PROFUN_12195 [Planoprotostelium fungivorum]
MSADDSPYVMEHKVHYLVDTPPPTVEAPRKPTFPTLHPRPEGMHPLLLLRNQPLSKSEKDFGAIMERNHNVVDQLISLPRRQPEPSHTTLPAEHAGLAPILASFSRPDASSSMGLPVMPEPHHLSISHPSFAMPEPILHQSHHMRHPSISSQQQQQHHQQQMLMDMQRDNRPRPELMSKFPDARVADFKHVIYNLLVDNYNNTVLGYPDRNFVAIVEPVTYQEAGSDEPPRLGFVFRDEAFPEKKLPELYSLHIRNAPLHEQDQSSIFIQDLYKYYLRSCVELLSKYFEKRGKYTFLYRDAPLFAAGSSLQEAEQRMKQMKTRDRMLKKKRAEEEEGGAAPTTTTRKRRQSAQEGLSSEWPKFPEPHYFYQKSASSGKFIPRVHDIPSYAKIFRIQREDPFTPSSLFVY